MDNFKVIYRILKTLERYMDYEEFDNFLLSAETLEISENRRIQIMRMLIDNGYIKGIKVKQYLRFEHTIPLDIEGNAPRITLKGLEYLEENSLMKKARQRAAGIVRIAE